MKNIGKLNNKTKYDPISILLFFFIVFMSIMFVYLTKINTNINKHMASRDAVSELQIINKKFDNFIYQQIAFVNYDKINLDISNFEKQLHFLDVKEYLFLIKNIKKDYDKKLKIIEHFKSKNALLVYSMHYLFNLTNAISKSKTLDKDTIHTVAKTILMIMRFYINPYIDSSLIIKNIDSLKSYIKTHTNVDVELEIFVNHASINTLEIKKFIVLRDELKDIHLDKSIEKLDNFLNLIYENNMSAKRLIIKSLFVFMVLVLIILFIMQLRSLKMRDELIGFSTAVENSYNSIVITDTDSNIVYVNDIAVKETGYTKEELIGQNPRILKSGNKSEVFYRQMHEDISHGRKWEGEFINKRKDGSTFYEKASIMPIFKDGKVVNYLSIKLNITDYIKEKEKVEHLAYHDTLTGLPNRANMEEYLRRLLVRARRDDISVAVLFIDLDKFKNINDTLGHDVGDELLVECAKRIQSALRESDIVARVGGDEFVVVMENIENEYSTAQVAKKILRLFNHPIITKEHQLNITLSIGISMFPDDAQDCITLFKYADVAMYDAKEKGRNNFQYYKKQLSIDVNQRLKVEQALRHALDKSELFLMYQPKYDLKTHNTVGLEALVRWQSPELGFVPPDKFIGIAEDTGDILEIGMFIFKKACENFIVFKQVNPYLKSISINISVIQLYQKNFISNIKEVVKFYDLKPQDIILEITESHVMKNVHAAMNILLTLKVAGFRISIDDFGTGYSSLSYLKQFPIDELKIDKSFVDDLPHNEDDIAIVRTIIGLSSSMGYTNTAEGIETKEQEMFLAKNKCQLGQGYYFCKPQKKDNLIEFFRATSNS